MKNDNKTKKIKVIKKNAIGVDKKPKPKEDTQEVTRRNMVATISDWVNDAQARRINEAKAAVESLYKINTQNA